jgi:hypothetical protein
MLALLAMTRSDATPSGPIKHAWALVVVEHGCGAGGELHPVQSLDHFQSAVSTGRRNTLS